MKKLFSLGLALLLAACSRSESTQATPEPVTSSSAAPLVLAPPGVRMVNAGSGDAAKVIAAERDAAKKEGRDVIVYVGAKWCEPCQRFHHAADKGELDAEFPNLTVVAFDLDNDRDRIVAAGYTSTYIPLFVVPNADGRASDKRFEGGVKGDKAVANLTPKLHQLLN